MSARPRTSGSASSPTRGRPATTPHRAHDRGDRLARIRLDRDRDRGAAARSQSDQAAAAALQRAAARRQVVSLHPDHRAITGRRRSSSTAARARGRASITARSPRSGRSTAPSRRCSARFCCARARTVLRKPHAAVPAASDQALLGAVHARDRVRRISPSWCARRTRSSPARAAP